MAKQIDVEGNERERWQLDKGDICQTDGDVHAVQSANGKWFVEFDLIVSVKLDERSVKLLDSFRVKCHQKGRKPRTVKAKAEKGKKGFQNVKS